MTVADCWKECQYHNQPAPSVVTFQCIECIFLAFFHWAVRVGGVIVFITLLIGGFKYLTAGSDPKAAQAAKNTITYAIIGLVLVILVWFILLFIEKFTGVTVTNFKIPVINIK